MNDTFAAIATPPGRGGIGIIRVSGPGAYEIALGLTGKKVLQPRGVEFCSLYGRDQTLIDQGLVLYFKAPHSFTGEDVVELQVHGAPMVLDHLLQETVALGARLARPGEFSERAFLNDKLDLTQAEAISDLIQANSQTAARMAVRSLQGDFSQKIQALSDQFVELRLYVEAAIDFPEEEIDFLNDGKIAEQLAFLLEQLESIQRTAAQGVILREGLSLVISGPPNAGKSTLMNTLSGRDVAIVTDVAGTTRDVMREQVLLDEIPVHLVDTAGLRESKDLVEQEGIKRAWDEVRRADCVLLVIDTQDSESTAELNQSIQAALPKDVPIIKVFNKIDAVGTTSRREGRRVYLSAKSGDGLSLLKEVIKETVGYYPEEGLFLARIRHIEALNRAHESLVHGQTQLTVHRAGELLAEDLRLAHQSLCEITGEFTSDELLGKIFSSFCIGK